MRMIVVIVSFMLASVSQATAQSQTKGPLIQVGSRQGPAAWSKKPVVIASHPTAPLFACGGAEGEVEGEIDVYLPQDGANGAFSIRSVCKMLNKSGAVTHIAMSGQTLVAIDEFGEVRVWHLANLLDVNGKLLIGNAKGGVPIIREPNQVLSKKVQRTTWLGLSADGLTCQVLANNEFQEFGLGGASASVVKLVSFQESANKFQGANSILIRGNESAFLNANLLTTRSEGKGAEIVFPDSSGKVVNVDFANGQRLITTSNGVHFWPSYLAWREEFHFENVLSARFSANGGILVLKGDGLKLEYRMKNGSTVSMDAYAKVDEQISGLREAAIKRGSLNLSSMQPVEKNFLVGGMEVSFDRRFFAISGTNSPHVIFVVVE